MTKWIKWAFVLCLLSWTFCACDAAGVPQPATRPKRVAVFGEKGFPYYGVTSSVTPAALVRDLNAAGIGADLVGLDTLNNPIAFSAADYAVLILPYGNTYPAAAQAAIRTFHTVGGSLIVSGIPFTHPVARLSNGEWSDLGHQDAPARFGPDGVGIGAFTGSEEDSAPKLSTAEDPLRLASLGIDWSPYAHAQRLDVGSEPAGDAIHTVVGSPKRPVVAVIERTALPFAGAVDVWAYRGPDGDLESWSTEQLFLRGAVYALERGSRITEGAASEMFARLSRLPKPPIYRNVKLPVVPRAYPTLHPKMPAPARRLFVADIRKCTPDERVLLISLQGLVNRTQPRIYLLQNKIDSFWLGEMQRQGHIDAAVPVSDPLSLVSRFRSSVRGAVVSDPEVYLSPCVAACLAGTDELVMATPELARRLALPIKADLRGKFKDNPAALKFIRTDLLPRLNPYLACCLDPAIFDSGALDQIIAAKGIVLWITGTKAQMLPGADNQRELAEVKALLAKLPLGGIVRGFWWHGEDIGINEGPGVSLASRFGKITVVSDYVANFSVFSGVPQTVVHQKKQAPPPPLDPTKVYFSFTVSDGDNLCTWRDYFIGYFQDPLHGTFPVGWGMGPSLMDVAPVWVRWYYDHATPNDEFLCDVSGVGYIYGPDWATALNNRDGAFADFYRLTAQYMKRLDMKTIRLMNVNAPDIAQAAKMMPSVRFLMPDYGNGPGMTYKDMTYQLPNDQVVFRAITGADPGPERLADQIRQRVGTTRPAFINVFIWNWGSKLADMKKLIEILGPEYVDVTPSQLHTLYRQANPAESAAN